MMKSILNLRVSVCGLVFCSGLAFADAHGPLVGLDYLEEVKQRIVNIDTDELTTLIEQEPSLVVIDVRFESEINGRGGMIDARREIIVPRGWLEFRMPNEVANLDTPIVEVTHYLSGSAGEAAQNQEARRKEVGRVEQANLRTPKETRLDLVNNAHELG